MFKRAKARWKGEWDRPSPTSILEKYVNKPGVFMHLSELGPNQKGALGDRFGLNPKQGYRTPFGVFGYPFRTKDFKDLKQGKLPFRQEAPWVHIFQVKLSRCLIASSYSESQLNKDKDKLASIWLSHGFDDPRTTIEQADKGARIQTPAGRLWNITRVVRDYIGRGGRTKAWTSVFRQLGYAGFYDDLCQSIIHKYEPCQIVVFEPTAFRRLDVVPNPSVFSGFEVYRSEGDRAHLKGWTRYSNEWDKEVFLPDFGVISLTISKPGVMWSLSFELGFHYFYFIDPRGSLHSDPRGLFVSDTEAAKVAEKWIRKMRRRPLRPLPPLSQWVKGLSGFELNHQKAKFHLEDSKLIVTYPTITLKSEKQYTSTEEAFNSAYKQWVEYTEKLKRMIS